MVTACPQCTHTNPAGAKFCYFDGYSLSAAAQDGPVDPGSRPFAQPFVFPSGCKCENFDQLVITCQKDWDSARNLLRAGQFEKFLGGMGRADLAMAAKEAVQSPDADRGLDQFMSRLPSQAVPGPRLQVEPREIRLEPLAVGQDSTLVVRLRNLGSRLVYGSVAADCPWLQPGDVGDSGAKLIQFAGKSEVKIAVRGQHLRAGPNPLEGKLVFDTNGGQVEVAVKVQVPVRAFTGGALAGAITPRQLAEKALKSPKDAAQFFENGSVPQWYKSNGWAYPVPGPAASGIGAVQQFFEALGLTKPPRLQVRDQDVQLAGAPGASLCHVLQVSTPDNKPIFVHASCDQPWLSAGRAQVKGAMASVPLEIRQVPDQPGTILSARVIVTGNGNQRFDIPVSLRVEGRAAVAALAPVGAAASVAVMKIKPKPTSTNPFQDLGKSAVSSKKLSPQKNRGAHDARENGFPAPTDIIVRPRSAPRSPPNSGDASRFLLHLIPLGVLLLVVAGLFVADIFKPDAPRQLAAFGEQKEEKVPPKKDADKKPALAVEFKIDEATEEILPQVKAQPVTVKIDDAPEEIVGKNQPPAPVKVEIKDEPEERVVKNGPALVKVEIKDEPQEVQGGKAIDAVPIDPNPLVNFILRQNSLASFGVVTTAAAGAAKKLTFSPDGATNTSVISVDGRVAPFGGPAGKRILRDGPGDAKKGKKQRGQLYSDETWAVGANPQGKGGIHFNQILEVVPGRQPVMIDGKPRRQLDNVLARYVIHNQDTQAHRVGIRFQIDTLIGNNDGVPFTVPGFPGLVNTWADFRTAKDMPDFIQALEIPNLQNPGTIAHMTLRVGGKIEPPSRVSLTHWSGGNFNWEVPVQNMGNDSAVILYWQEKLLKPGEKREIGYAYGLGAVSSQETVGKLGVTLGGSFEPGQTFTITAYVENPIPGQTLTLELPDGLQQVEGKKIMPVPPAGKGGQQTSIVTWKAKVLRTGDFPVRVRSSTGVTQTKTISIARTEEPTGGKFRLTLDGSFEPGQVFEVIGKVTEPVPQQTLTLTLPPGLEEVDKATEKPVPTIKEGKEAEVRWKVKVLDAGKYQLKVASSTGVTQSKTITIVRPDIPTGGKFRMLPPEGSFEPGQHFQITCKVAAPVPGQTLTLKVSKGLELTGGTALQNVPAAAAGEEAAVQWKVKVLEAGRHQLQVASSTGVIQTKTITIDRPAGPQSGQLQVSLQGEKADFAPGKTFQVIAKVSQPVAGQTLTLLVPKGLQSMGQDMKPVVQAPNSTVAWPVKVLVAGKYPIKVSSSTGVAVKKTLTIKQPQAEADPGGAFTMVLKATTTRGEFEITAKVARPVKGQTLTLRAQEGMVLKSEATQPVKDVPSTLTWRFRVTRAGVVPVRVESSTGHARTTNITITAPAGKGIFD